MFNIDFDASIDHLPIFVLNMLKLCHDNSSSNDITSCSAYVFDRLVEYFTNLDSKSQE